jgi:hypothetical protein
MKKNKHLKFSIHCLVMKKLFFIGIVLTFLFSVTFVRADQVNMNISVNGTSNLNITINADDTLARQMASQVQSDLNNTQSDLNNTQTDIYGTEHHSGPKDMILDEIMSGAGNPVNGSEGLDTIKEICNDPYLQNYLRQIGTLPPADFVSYVKALGYDDESHIDFIWTICQQEYINNNQGNWSLVGGGMQPGDLLSVLRDAVGWLMGSGSTTYSQSRDIATTLDSYFASDRDVTILVNKINQLDMRIQALERTMENVSAEAYCQAKLDMMKEYNLTGVKCGTNSTMYWNAKKAGFDNYDTIAYKDCNEDWICTKWSDCSDGTQTRKCVDNNDCGTFSTKPAETQACEVSSQQTALPQSIAPTPSKSVAKVESFVIMSQLISENYMSILVMALILIPSALIIVGIKKDISPKKRRR